MVNKFTQMMANTGYSKSQARRVIISSLKGMRLPCREQRDLGSGCTEVLKAGAEGRNIKKLLAKTSCYKERDQEASAEAESDEEPFDSRVFN